MKCDKCCTAGINLGKEKGTCDYIVTIKCGRKKPLKMVLCSDHVKDYKPSENVVISDYKGLRDCPKCHGTGSVPINYAQGICSFLKPTNKRYF